MDYPKDYIVWDLETTGLQPGIDKILEIGCIVVQNLEIVEKHSWLLDNDVQISERITEITSIDNKLIREEGIPVADALLNFRNVFSRYPGYKHITHNGIRFDIPFLSAFTGVTTQAFKDLALDTAVVCKAKKLGLSQRDDETFWEFGNRVMNIWAKGIKYNVKLMCEELEIDMTNIQLHRALGDVLMTNEIYKKVFLNL